MVLQIDYAAVHVMDMQSMQPQQHCSLRTHIDDKHGPQMMPQRRLNPAPVATHECRQKASGCVFWSIFCFGQSCQLCKKLLTVKTNKSQRLNSTTSFECSYSCNDLVVRLHGCDAKFHFTKKFCPSSGQSLTSHVALCF